MARRKRDEAFSKRAALRKRSLQDYEQPPTQGPHPWWQEVATDALLGGVATSGRPVKAAGEVVARGLERRTATRAAAAASERRLAEMAAPRAASVAKARGGGLLTDVLGTPLDAQTAFNEADAAKQALNDALMKTLKLKK